MATTAGEVVREFAAAMLTGDLDRAFGELALEDMVYETVPLEPPAQVVQGRDVIRARLEALYSVATCERFDILRQVEQEGLVMHERVDAYRFPSGMFPAGEIFVMRIASVYEVRDGRVALWRDYFDVGCFQTDLGVDLAEFGRRVGHAYAKVDD